MYTVHADVWLRFSPTDASLPPITVLPGENFSVDVFVEISGPEAVAGLTLFLESPGAPGVFSLVGRDFSGSFFDEAVTPPEYLVLPMDLAPLAERDLGGFNSLFEVATSSISPLFVARLTFAVNPGAASGAYEIVTAMDFAHETVWIDAGYESHPLAGTGFIVAVIPEPRAMGIGGIVFLAVLAMARRRSLRGR